MLNSSGSKDNSDLNLQNDDEKNEEKDKTTLSIISLYKHLGQTISLAFLSTLFYYVSYTYYSSFCKRLSLPFKVFDLPLTFFVGDLVNLIVVIIIIFSILLLIRYYLNYYSNYINNIIEYLKIRRISNDIMITINILASIIGTIIPLSSHFGLALNFQELFSAILLKFESDPILLSILATVVSVLFGAILNFIFKKLRDMPQSAAKDEANNVLEFITKLDIIPFMGFIIILIFLAGFAGSHNAESLIEGTSEHIEINITHDDKNISLPSDMILIMVHEGNYYLIEKKSPPPENIDIYILPVNKAKIAVARGIKHD